MSVRFGAFEVDVEGRRLLKKGMPVTLREQSFQVLTALMERPGEIVTREELRRRLWPSDTFVDFEVALNSAVSRLRDALGDSANSPSVIETIPKRGYRFVVPIPKRPAVAVMPFVNQTGDAKDEYLSDGLTDELIRVLSRNDALRITASSVVFRFKGQRWDARQVGQELGVEAILEGSVWRSGDRIRITVRLVGVKDGFNIWAHRFDSTLEDLFGIQDEVCTAVADALHVRLGSPIREHRPGNMEAYVQYLKGAHLLKKRRPVDIRRAFEYQLEAIRLDPGYAESYYGAAMYYNVSAAFGALPPQSALLEAEKLVSKGLALDESSVTLHSTLGMARMFQWRWAESEQAHRRALSLEPTNAFAHMCYPILCSFLGRHDEAVLHAAKSVELDPLDLMTNYWDIANKGKKLNEGLALGEGYFGYLAGVLGYNDEARRVTADLQARREREYAPALPIAWTYLGLGETDKALDWLEIALAERDPYLASVIVFPGYDPIRDQPRFKQLAHQLKLPS